MPTLDIPVTSSLHAKLISKISSRVKIAKAEQQKHHVRWKDAEERVLAYVPESLADAKRRHRREDGESQYTTIQIPYTYAVVMTAHTYWTSVFFGRSPIHQFAGRHGAGEDQVLALEALIQYQVDAGEMLAPYYLWFYDAAKYGVGILGSYWDRQTIQYGTLEDDGTGKFQLISRAVAGYTGSCAYNVSPYDFFHDPRVTMGNFQKGEFCFNLARLGWHEVLRKRAKGDYMNVDKMPRGKSTGEENTSARLERPQDNWELDSGDADGKGKHPARARLYEFYVDCIPSEWGVGTAEMPEKWVFTITEDLSTIIGATPLGAIHGMFPFDVIEPEMEAYGIFNRGIPELVQPLQETMDWLWNSHMWNVRAALNNQFIMDPSRIMMKDVRKGGAGFVFRLKPEAYGQDVRTMFHQVPVNDVTKTNVDDINTMFAFGERSFGINEQMFGMLSEGSARRTATEVRSSTGFGVNRQKTQSEWISASSFSRHAKKLLANSQQYYSGEQKFRVVGDLALSAGEQFLTVSPEIIAGQFDYVAVDGTLPIDRFAQVTMWKDMLASLTSTDMGLQVMQTFDIGKLIGWVFSLGGLKNINRFKVEVMPPGVAPGGPGMMPMPAGPAMALPPGGTAMNGSQSPDMTGSDIASALAETGAPGGAY